MSEYGKGFVIPKWLIPIAILGILAVLFGPSISNSFSGTSSTSADSTNPNPAPKDELTQNNVPVVTETAIAETTTTRTTGNRINTYRTVTGDKWFTTGGIFDVPGYGSIALSLTGVPKPSGAYGNGMLTLAPVKGIEYGDSSIKLRLKTGSGKIITTDPQDYSGSVRQIMFSFVTTESIVEWQPEIDILTSSKPK